VLHCENVDGIQHGTPIYYLDQRAGEVRSYRMTGYHSFDVTAVIEAPFDRLEHTGTKFWNAGAIRFSKGVDGPKLQLLSLAALAEGAIAFETPPVPASGPTAKRYDRFELYDSQDRADNAPDGHGVSYEAVFTHVSTSLDRYAPVEPMGTRIGSVGDAKLEYSPVTGRLNIRATLVLEPSRIHLADGAVWSSRPRGQMDAMLGRPIAQGLRASLSTSPPVIGGQMVVLEMVPGETGKLIPGAIPRIPTTSGSDISQMLRQANDIERKIGEMPLEQVAARMNRSAANLESVTAEARDQLPATLKSARESVSAAQQALNSAQNLLSSGSTIPNQTYTADVPQALYEMTEAARSLRELSNFIDRHPEALIRGRGDHQ
jgi:paraquat-inducible protein B